MARRVDEREELNMITGGFANSRLDSVHSAIALLTSP